MFHTTTMVNTVQFVAVVLIVITSAGMLGGILTGIVLFQPSLPSNSTPTPTPTCAPFYLDCDSNLTTWCETNVFRNQQHCGSCGNACNATSLCLEVSCVQCYDWQADDEFFFDIDETGEAYSNVSKALKLPRPLNGDGEAPYCCNADGGYNYAFLAVSPPFIHYLTPVYWCFREFWIRAGDLIDLELGNEREGLLVGIRGTGMPATNIPFCVFMNTSETMIPTEEWPDLNLTTLVMSFTNFGGDVPSFGAKAFVSVVAPPSSWKLYLPLADEEFYADAHGIRPRNEIIHPDVGIEKISMILKRNNTIET